MNAKRHEGYPLFHVLLCCAIAVLLAACASALKKPEPPQVSLVGLDVIDAGVLEQRYALKLRLQNSNDFALAIQGMNYEVFINEQSFAHGVSRSAVTIPAFGEDVIELEATSGLARIFEQLRNLGEGTTGSWHYRVIGGVKLENWPVKLPFEYQGELRLLDEDKTSEHHIRTNANST